jgi:lipopolysaccharide/colanic/teichoic acid biosynthesis glycosyltransferase
MTSLSKIIKRLIDVFVALFGLGILLPLLLLAAVLIRINLGSPVFFIQTRPGLNDYPFKLIKFRSMLPVNDDNKAYVNENNRLTRFGKILRATSIDELPTLWNVLRGDMSLVGPRPLLLEYLPLYNNQQKRRHLVRPGITGSAQVSGRNALSWEEKFNLDVSYVQNQSLVLDMKILALTVWKVLNRDGIESPTDGITKPFTGTDSVVDDSDTVESRLQEIDDLTFKSDRSTFK